jgi:hypothetical protein
MVRLTRPLEHGSRSRSFWTREDAHTGNGTVTRKITKRIFFQGAKDGGASAVLVPHDMFG